MSINYNKIFFLLLLIMPLSIVIGPSYLNKYILIILLYFLIFVKSFITNFYTKINCTIIIRNLYIYLIINSLISLDHEIDLREILDL